MQSSSSAVAIFSSNLCKKGVSMGLAQNKNIFILAEITKQIISFPKRFILSKQHRLWLSYDCLSILCDVFLLKRVIFRHNNFVLKYKYPIFMHFKFHLTNKAGIFIFITLKKRNESWWYIYSYYIKQTAHLDVYYLAKMVSNWACK